MQASQLGLADEKTINAPICNDAEVGEWQDHLVDQSPSPEAIVLDQDEKDCQRKALIAAIDVLDDRGRRIFEAAFGRRTTDAGRPRSQIQRIPNASGKSRCARSRKCAKRPGTSP